MKRIDRLLEEVKARYCRSDTVTVCFMDGTHRQFSFMEAFQLCANDENVVDAITEDSTGTSLLRTIIDADKDFSELSEFGE